MMKSTIRRIAALLLTLVVCSSLVVTAFAATKVKSVKHTSPVNGYASETFYVTAEDKGTTKLQYTCTKGSFVTGKKNGSETAKSIYGYYEIRVWGKSNGTWKELTKYKENIKNDATGKVDMKGYTEYKVQIYSWKTPTISTYRDENYSKARWSEYHRPSITFSSTSSLNVKSFAK